MLEDAADSGVALQMLNVFFEEYYSSLFSNRALQHTMKCLLTLFVEPEFIRTNFGHMKNENGLWFQVVENNPHAINVQ